MFLDFKPVSMVSSRAGWRLSACGLAPTNDSTCNRNTSKYDHKFPVLLSVHHSQKLSPKITLSQSSRKDPPTPPTLKTFNLWPVSALNCVPMLPMTAQVYDWRVSLAIRSSVPSLWGWRGWRSPHWAEGCCQQAPERFGSSDLRS